MSLDANSFKTWVQNDPYSEFYNTQKLTDVFLTCDIDWAPDHCTEIVVEAVKSYDFKMTFFATHKSELLSSLSPQQFEVGLHPDFTRQREMFETSLKKLKDLYPNAIGMRAHRNFFGQNISDLAKKTGLKYDISTFLWLTPFQQIHKDYNSLLKMSYFWEDGIHLDTSCDLATVFKRLTSPGLKIINCHPVLLALNSPDENHRRTFTSKYSDLTSASIKDVQGAHYKNAGIFNIWLKILDFLKENNVKTRLASEMIR